MLDTLVNHHLLTFHWFRLELLLYITYSCLFGLPEPYLTKLLNRKWLVFLHGDCIDLVQASHNLSCKDFAFLNRFIISFFLWISLVYFSTQCCPENDYK